jgi:glycosyltransferase involved in cell wall biosynthesis
MTLPTGTSGPQSYPGGGTQREGAKPPSRPPQISPAHPGPALPRSKPVLFITGHAPPDRVGAFTRLHELENVEFALFGGRSKHGGPAPARDLPFPHRHIHPHEPAMLAASGRYRAVVCSTGGRLAPAAAWAGTRRARLPLILWTALWAHPRSAAHALSFLALRRLYRSADAVVTYGPHVSAYVSARGARNAYVAPQAVDNAFWRSSEIAPPRVRRWPRQAETKFLFVGRPAREKGLRVLTEAWRTTGLRAPTAALVLVGAGPNPPWAPAGGAAGDLGVGEPAGAKDGEPAGARNMGDDSLWMDPVPPVELRNLYAACDVLVVPSIATRTFREPWGLVVNEAMNRGLPVIATDAVGAAAGGLVRDGHNGCVVPASDSAALADAMLRLAANPALRAQLGEAGRQDVRAFTYDAWAAGFSRAFASLGVAQGD